MPPLNIFIGGEIFRRLREEKRYYVDKTGLIEEMFSSNQPLVTLITRPRRFGKTLNMTMLQEFFDIQKDSRSLFEGLAISKNIALCEAWMNKYPVLFLSLKGVEGRNYDLACGQMADLLSEVCAEHAYLLKSADITSDDKKRLARLMAQEGSENDLSASLRLLCRVLESHWGKPVILLIDEYDVPVNCAEQNGYYKEMLGFMRNLLGAALKTNPALKFAVLTGCLRIARESIFTGLNNFMCYSISDAEYEDKFGFTEAEVDKILADANLNNKKTEIKEWYDGYRFGTNKEIYCPWDILTHVVRLQKNPNALPQAYWKNSSGNAIVRTLIEQAGHETQQKIEALIEGQSIEEECTEDVTYDLLYESDSNIWTMLYVTGYLTKAAVQPDNGTIALVIPNKEIRELFTGTVSKWFRASLKNQDLSAFAKAVWDGNAEAVQNKLADILYGTISYYDSAESFYHGFMTGLLRGAGLMISSNRESGLGRADIAIVDGRNKRAIIIELKYSHEYENLESRAEEALKQIEEKNYAHGLPPNIRTVINYGISFWKKECCVKTASQNLIPLT